ncbi:MAG: NAD(P)-binding protein, partial [Methyloversatilis sp.]|nr:NAD(P)-binding protein [Methyloversatilis sp.]
MSTRVKDRISPEREIAKVRDIAVIGAGMAGCALTRRLVDAGLNVQVFDKGRAAGGRLATRRADRLQFDHGVQYMTVRGEAMKAQLADWQRAGVASAWTPIGLDASPRWVGVPGMNAIAPRMLWGAEVHMETAIAGFGRDHLGGWRVTTQGR